MLPIMMYANVTEQQPGRFTCTIIWPDSHANIIPGLYSFTIYSLVLGFVIPLCFIMTFYCMVIKKLRSVAKKTNRPKGKRRSHRKVTKLVLTVITVYIFCWLPYWVAQVTSRPKHWNLHNFKFVIFTKFFFSQVSLISSPIESEGCSTRLKVMLFLFVCWLSYSNSAINPILYAYLSDNFKKSFLKACTCAATKDVNAQLKLENSGVGMKKLRDRRTSESTQPTCTTRCKGTSELTMTMTTTTGTSNLPSPPIRRTNGSITFQHYFQNSDETLNSGEVISSTGNRHQIAWIWFINSCTWKKNYEIHSHNLSFSQACQVCQAHIQWCARWMCARNTCAHTWFRFAVVISQKQRKIINWTLCTTNLPLLSLAT